MGNIWIEEEWINATQNFRTGRSGVYETFTDNVGELFRHLQSEYGRCKSKVYIDTKTGDTLAIGWVFEKRVKYLDCDGSFLQETWITLHDKPPTKTVKYHYKKIAA